MEFVLFYGVYPACAIFATLSLYVIAVKLEEIAKKM